MKRFALGLTFVVALLAGGALTSGCHPPPTIVTPVGRTAFSADQVVLRINELQNAAIGANAANAVDTNTTRKIVQFCVSANKTIAQIPNGWQQTVGTAWAQLKAALPPSVNPAVNAALDAVDVVLATLGT